MHLSPLPYSIMESSNYNTDNHFSWVPIQTEAVQKILSLQEDREELLAALEAMNEASLTTRSLDDQQTKDSWGKLTDMDPFTFLANFNRGTKKYYTAEKIEV